MELAKQPMEVQKFFQIKASSKEIRELVKNADTPTLRCVMKIILISPEKNKTLAGIIRKEMDKRKKLLNPFKEYGYSPCRNCDRRVIGCHGKCEDYQDFRLNKEVEDSIQRDARFKNSINSTYHKNVVAKENKRKGR